MDNAELTEIKRRLPEYLERKGIDIKHKFNCLNPHHEDIFQSMEYDSITNRVHCFKCHRTYNILDLIMMDYGYSDLDEAEQLAHELYIIPSDPGRFEKKC